MDSLDQLNSKQLNCILTTVARGITFITFFFKSNLETQTAWLGDIDWLNIFLHCHNLVFILMDLNAIEYKLIYDMVAVENFWS